MRRAFHFFEVHFECTCVRWCTWRLFGALVHWCTLCGLVHYLVHYLIDAGALVHYCWCTMSALHWNDVKQLAALNQDGSSGFPPHWVMKHLEEHLDIAPLRFGGDDYGYLMWFRPQGKSIVDGMRVLKGALAEYDDLVARNLELERELAECRTGASFVPAPAPRADDTPSTDERLARIGSGEEAYALRVDGLSWPEIGARLGLGSPLNAAKKHARSHDLPWPPALGSS